MHTKYEYYNNGLSSATVKKADDVSRTYKYFYYDDGQTESVKDPLEGVTFCTYDKDGNVETVL